MKNLVTSLLLLAGLVAASSCDKDSKPAPATNMMTLSGDMSSSNIVVSAKPVVSSGTGKVVGSFNKDTNEMAYTITFSGLTGDAVLGHFHIGAPTVNGPVTIDLKTAGATTLTSPITGKVTLTTTQRDALLGGNLYANLHTAQNKPDGEIRATVVAK